MSDPVVWPRSSPRRRVIPGCALVVALLGLTGCGKPMVNPTGKVTFKNRPVQRASLQMVSKDGSEEVFIAGMTDGSGVLQLDTSHRGGVPVGKYTITVSWWVLTRGGGPLPEGEAGEALKDTPAATNYTATLEKEITPETTTLDLEVEGKAQRVKTED
jgi:hypothetical protein